MSFFDIFRTERSHYFPSAFEDVFNPEPESDFDRRELEAKAAQAAARVQRDVTRMTAAYQFLRVHFDKLAEEQAEGLTNATIGDYTRHNVKAFEEKLSFAYRLLIHQADTRFGAKATDKALEECGFGSTAFRIKNGCV